MIYKIDLKDLNSKSTNFADDFNKYIKKSEFPAGVPEWLHYQVIANLEAFRTELPKDCYFTPSPIAAAHIRETTSDSAHSTKDKTQLSVGTDIFVPVKYWWAVWTLAPRFFKGVGLYLDRQINGVNTPMLHFDLKDRNLVWVHSNATGYVYNPVGIAKLLIEAAKKWGV